MKNAEVKLPFGLNEYNILIHITDVESGKCSLVCPSCRSSLLAVKGNKNQHHFRHDIVKECKGGLESAIHLAAKQIIKEKMQITLPKCISTASIVGLKGKKYTKQEVFIQDGTVIYFDSVQEEIELHGMKADLLATTNDEQFIIEICYRHKVDDQKLAKIVNANISAIEINLSILKPSDVRDWDAFWKSINDPAQIKWLNNAKATDYNLILKTELQQVIIAKERREQKRLTRALKNIKILSSTEYIAHLNQEAKSHHAWERHSPYLSFAWNELPDFLNVPLSNGDWIFKCDRRIWQMAIYSFFFCRNMMVFSTERVYKWLINEGFKISISSKIIEKYYRKYPELITLETLDNIPLAWKVLEDYFNHLCKLGMLKFSKDYSGENWVILSKKPNTT